MLVPLTRTARCQGKTHPCPRCGTPGRRVRRLHRRLRSIAFQQQAFLDVHYAEYKSRCSCCKSFRSWPVDVPPKADYDARVRQAVLDRLLVDRLNVAQTKTALRRDFLLELSDGFVYDCLRWQVARLEGVQGERWRALLIRLSGRQMKQGVSFTLPALLAGLWVLLAMTEVLQHYDLEEIQTLAATILPKPPPPNSG